MFFLTSSRVCFELSFFHSAGGAVLYFFFHNFLLSYLYKKNYVSLFLFFCSFSSSSNVLRCPCAADMTLKSNYWLLMLSTKDFGMVPWLDALFCKVSVFVLFLLLLFFPKCSALLLLQNVGCLQQRRHQAGRGRPPATRTTTATPATALMGRRNPGQTPTPSTLTAGACPWSVYISLWLLLPRMEDVGCQISLVGEFGVGRIWGWVGGGSPV